MRVIRVTLEHKVISLKVRDEAGPRPSCRSVSEVPESIPRRVHVSLGAIDLLLTDRAGVVLPLVPARPVNQAF